MSRTRSLVLALLSALGLAPQVLPLAAQETYPNRSIHLIVPFPAGGPSDVLARMIGQKMSIDFGQPVVVENRVGANTIIGAQVVVKAPPDGYTLLMAIDSTLVMNQFLYRNLPYDPFKDFAPITLVAKTLGLLMVNSASEVKTVKDLIAKAKANPGKLNFGAGTITTKLTGYIFNDVAGVDTQLVPYNGSAEVANAILTKAVDFVFDGTSAELPLIESGRLRALAKLDPRPFPPAPDVPTLEDATGLKFGDLAVWLGMVAPKGTPPAIIDKLAQETAKALSDPEVKAKADAAGLFPATSTPAEFAAFIRSEAARWQPVVKKSGMHFD